MFLLPHIGPVANRSPLPLQNASTEYPVNPSPVPLSGNSDDPSAAALFQLGQKKRHHRASTEKRTGRNGCPSRIGKPTHTSPHEKGSEIRCQYRQHSMTASSPLQEPQQRIDASPELTVLFCRTAAFYIRLESAHTEKIYTLPPLTPNDSADIPT